MMDNIEQKNSTELLEISKKADYIVTKNYLSLLETLPVVSLPDNDEYDITKHTTIFKIDKIVYDKDENNLEKLTNVYTAMYAMQANVVMIIQSNGNEVTLYFGICDSDKIDRCTENTESLYNNIIGNFPGSIGIPLTADNKREKQAMLSKTELSNVMNGCFKDNGAISTVSGIAAMRDENRVDNKTFAQGIEKMIDTMRGVSFSAIFIAQPLTKPQLEDLKAEYELIYSGISPYARTTLTMSESESQGVSKTISQSLSDSFGTSKSTALSVGESKSEAHTVGTSTTHTDTGGAYGGAEAGPVHFGASYSHSYSRTKSFSNTVTFGKSNTKTRGESINQNHTVTISNADGTQSTYSLGKSLQLNYENKSVLSLMENIDLQLKRIRECESFGMFATAAYFISTSPADSQMAASAYKSIISGDETSIESAHINTWDKDNNIEAVESYLERLWHPIFRLDDVNIVTPATIVSSKELALHMSLPKKSVNGISVVDSAPFGRNIYTLSGENPDQRNISVGKIYHMGNVESNDVNIDLDRLTSHTFVTGSTGAGKSNTVYNLLHKAMGKDVKVLIVEPAKGEYKDIFGGNNNVQVYGTNHQHTKLLRINPFSFPKGIHVYEHLDRLVEIFNACWPMYAAMPAVLKEAIEKAYIAAGWNMQTSENTYNIFPSFSDVLEKIDEVMNETKYSADSKGDYTGALSTRVKSMTTGINRMIFTNDELTFEELFESNVIVDLSRLGSAETKSLIMGLMIMKLQEYRIASNHMSNNLEHLTVLEEAHNLLKRTSSEQSSESANLLGKSVEMLANAIAEMRAYGEGFIIADQSPGLLDMSVIRNTNTKIVLRLPDYSDRQLVGKAMGLNEHQIEELSKLPRGVAAVSQNDWLETVLCRFDKYNSEGKWEDQPDDVLQDDLTSELIGLIMEHKLREHNVDEFRSMVLKTNSLSSDIKRAVLDYISPENNNSIIALSKLACKVFNYSELKSALSHSETAQSWERTAMNIIRPAVNGYSIPELQNLLLLILQEIYRNDIRYSDVYNMYSEHIKLSRRHGAI